MKARRWALAPATVAGGYAVARALVRRRVRSFETFDPDSAELPGERFYVRGRRIHLRITGTGPPLLLLHGFAASGEYFDSIAPYLRDRYTLLAPDRPGFGFSDRAAGADYSHGAQAALFLDLLDRLGIERTAVIGHSLGAAVALRMAARQPARIPALVLAAGPGRDERVPRVLGPIVDLVLPLLLESPAVIRWVNRTAASGGRGPDGETIERLLRVARVRGTAAAWSTMLLRTQHDAPPPLGAIRTPTLVMAGEKDRYLSPTTARRMAEALPNGRAVVIAGARHLLMVEQRDACVRELAGFLDSVSGLRPAAADATLLPAVRR
jgi:pimeloyl-ACP methyl ester carboxylesterase